MPSARPLLMPRSAPHRGPASSDPPRGPILVATRGSHVSDHVVRLAWLLGGRSGAAVHVVTAVDPGIAEAHHVARVRRQVTDVVGADWPISIGTGRPDDVIASTAAQLDARLVVLGRSPHRVNPRVAAGGSLGRLLRHTRSPAYSVDDDARGLARRVVVAMDFSPHAIEAARRVREFVAPDAVLTLAHVWPRGGAIAGWERTYERALPAMFEAAMRQLEPFGGVQVESVALTGYAPGSAIATYAAGAGADLVVAGTRGHGMLTRLAVGTVAAHLVSESPCSFFCVPCTSVAAAPAAPPVRWRRRLFQEGV